MLYRSLAQDFEDQIRSGVIRAGERLPSVRQLSKERNVSVSTVQQAYLTLETRGFAEARPQSGYYAKLPLAPALAMTSPKLSLRCGPVRTSDIVDSMRRFSRDAEFFQLGCALMSSELYPLRKLSQSLRHESRYQPNAVIEMDFPPGSLRLRRQISKRYHELGLKLSPDDLVITSGCNEAINLALRCTTKPGDAVLVESPTYFVVLEILQAMGLRAVEVPCDPNTGLDLKAARDAFRKFPIRAGFVTPNFSNPTGSLMPDENKEELVRLFRENGAHLIEDDIYSEISFSDIRPKPLRYFDNGDTVITCSSFTKTLGPGLRVGWIIPGKKHEEIERAKYLLNGGTPLAMSELVANVLESHTYERYLRKVRQKLSLHVGRISESVVRHFPKGTQLSQPQGGFVLWVRLPPGCDGVDLYRKALRAKIGFAPGVIFSASGRFTDHIRISCGAWSQATDRAIARLAALL